MTPDELLALCDKAGSIQERLQARVQLLDALDPDTVRALVGCAKALQDIVEEDQRHPEESWGTSVGTARRALAAFNKETE